MTCNCNGGNLDEFEINNNCNNSNNSSQCPRFFPRTIGDALRRSVCQNVILTFVNGNRERVRIECVTDDLVIVRDQNCFRFISIDCICSITVSRENILNDLLGICD